MNFQGVTKKRMYLKCFPSDMGEKTIIRNSQTWLTTDVDLSLSNVASSNHELIRFDTNRNNEKKKGGGLMFIALSGLAPEERKDLNVFD